MIFKKFNNFISLKSFYWVYIILLGLIFTFFVPPFQKPDAEFHYYNAYSVLNKGCVFKSDSGGYMNIPKDVYEFREKLLYNKIVGSYVAKFPKSLLSEKYISSSTEDVVFNRVCVKYGLLSYFPNIIGLKLGGSNLLFGFYLARFFGFLFFLIVLFVSFKLVGRYYPLVIAFSIIPMVIHQVTAVSYDSIHISLGLLSFSLYLYLKNNFYRVKPYLLYLFYVLLLVFSLSKGGYYLLLILPILLPVYPFYKKKTKNIIIKLLVLSIYYLLVFLLIKRTLGYIDNLRIGLFDSSVQKMIILNDPLYFIKVLIDTTSKYFYFYWISFFGDFGGLDYQAHFGILLLITIVDFYVISRFKFNKKIISRFFFNDFIEIICVLGIAVDSYIIVLTSMYLYWATIAANTIDGSQGRYFFIPFLFLIYGIIRFIEAVGIKKSKYFFIFLVLIMVSGNIIRSVYLRYYDYSGVYSNNNELNFDEYKDYKKNKLEFKSVPVVDNKICENVGDNKIGGFEIYFVNNIKENEYLKDVFKYEISSGNKILHSGYLDQTKIQKEGEYIEEFKKILSNKGKGEFCVRLYKKYSQQNNKHDLYFVEKDGIGVKFLKIAK